MSREKIEVVRAAYDHLNRGDVEALAALCGDDFHIDMSERVFNPATYSGRDGIHRFYEDVMDVWASYRWDVEETRVAGDSVVAMLHCEGEGREGGNRVDWRPTWVWTFRQNAPMSARLYRERIDALADLGLSE